MSKLTENTRHSQQEDSIDLGNFYPTHHVVLAFEQEQQAREVGGALRLAGFRNIREIDDKHMLSASQRGLDTVDLIASMGSSQKTVELHNRLAREGCHFLMVRAPSDDDTEKLMEIIRQNPFRLAQKYHRLIIQTLQ